MQKFLQGMSIREIIKISRKVASKEDKTAEIQRIIKSRKVFGESSVKIPEVKWDDVGGLADAKEEILQTIMLP